MTQLEEDIAATPKQGDIVVIPANDCGRRKNLERYGYFPAMQMPHEIHMRRMHGDKLIVMLTQDEMIALYAKRLQLN